ncbi:MAG: hypothetical protein COA69_07285 [Robiginitomaculum sp.]|nr:MAG: hypothetical protein COA69_07285 [Robiginitomaculum sp.]
MSKKTTKRTSIGETILIAILFAASMIILAKLLPKIGLSEDMTTTLSLIVPALAFNSWIARRRGGNASCW